MGCADQYALGATAYHQLTGHPVFDYSNPAVVISHHLNASPPALADRSPELAALDTGLHRALAKSPVVTGAILSPSGSGYIVSRLTSRRSPPVGERPISLVVSHSQECEADNREPSK